MPEANLSSYNIYNSALQEILNSEGAAQYKLPDLVTEKGAFARWLEKLFDWFQPRRSVENLAWDLSKVMEAAMWILIILALVTLIWALYRYWGIRKQRRGRHSSPSLLRRKKSFYTDLENIYSAEIKKALEQEQWSRACRLRWKLFLKKTRLDDFLTPREFTEKLEIEWPPGDKIQFYRIQNKVMFGKGSKLRGDFETVDRWLFQIESRLQEI